jgi:hypothetical protein
LWAAAVDAFISFSIALANQLRGGDSEPLQARCMSFSYASVFATRLTVMFASVVMQRPPIPRCRQVRALSARLQQAFLPDSVRHLLLRLLSSSRALIAFGSNSNNQSVSEGALATDCSY